MRSRRDSESGAAMSKVQAAIVGAGPAGLSAALVLARSGAKVAVFDENDRPGGQLFKQIHKFFGSSEHGAGIRGFRLGEQLLKDCLDAGVEMHLSAVVYGYFRGNVLGVIENGLKKKVEAERVILATGASERPLNFPGWDRTGVMGAGAAQTMINLHRVLPGKRFLMVGSGNVGLVVGYQILQAGGELAGIVEALDHVNGYRVHADKLRRAGVPFYLSHTVKEVTGEDGVEQAVIVKLDEKFQPIPGTELTLDADTVCLAVGLNPSVELLRMAGAQFTHIPQLGGYIPLHDADMKTSVDGLYVAGDVSGIEEASAAMETGKLAGTAAAASLSLLSEEEKEEAVRGIRERLSDLRSGKTGDVRRQMSEEVVRRYEQWAKQ